MTGFSLWDLELEAAPHHGRGSRCPPCQAGRDASSGERCGHGVSLGLSAALAGLGFAGKGLEWVVLARGTRRLNRQKAGRNLFSVSAWDVG